VECPFCDLAAPPRELHAHLLERHADQVTVEDGESRRIYRIECPTCGAEYSQPIKPRLRDAGFVQEFDREIRLVAFDMLVNHLIAEHETTESPLESPLPDIRPYGGTDAPGSKLQHP
jgi:hypothetical protein